MAMLCRCGCGQATPIARRNRRELGHVKGQPIPYVNGHNRRGQRAAMRWVERDCGHRTPCWIWIGVVEANGYGKGTAPDGRRTWAHRAIYEELVGEIGEGLDLDHLCRVRNCVNPEHLEPVTRAENLRRGAGNGGHLCSKH